MNLHAVYHKPRGNYAYFDSPDTVFLLFRAGRGDLKNVEVFYFDKYIHKETLTKTKMEKYMDDVLFSYYRVRIKPPYKRLAYYFRAAGKDGTLLYYDEFGFHENDAGCWLRAFQMPYINEPDVIRIPEWAKHAVFYHIFPDSFARSGGGFEGDPKWGSEPHPRRHLGGDLRGMIDNFSYIKELGVNALYLCPIFASNTCHRYNTRDYRTIDPRLGTMEDFAEFLALCHSNGVRVLLDAVFNHTCDTFPAFLDVIEKGEASPYKDWYFIRSWPVKVDGEYRYDRFAFTPHMPKLNTGNPEAAEYLLDTAEFWTKTGIDGWRLDVANEVDLAFWRGFRRRVKAVNPDALILGEMWNDSLPYLAGDTADSVMNYPFFTACREFFLSGEIDAEGFRNIISGRLAAYPYPMVYAMYNLLGSHDTSRWLTEAKGDLRKVILSMVFQFTFVGMPVIYYGDETAMEGENPIQARRCMDFNPGEKGQTLLALCKKLVSLRKQSRALREGDFAWLETPGSLLGSLRTAEGERVWVYINNSREDAMFTEGPPGEADLALSSGGDAGGSRIEPFGYRVYQKCSSS
ncbi:MAG: glycoside hydrolase family 13 protein [Treponema sp.]|jgi:glycosidase|nr:glycoside hydrolase family 13 protein [Treponema sp.]